MSYQPVVIGNYEVGLFGAREKWLTPASAWRTLTNGYVSKGRVAKRKGYELHGTLEPMDERMFDFEDLADFTPTRCSEASSIGSGDSSFTEGADAVFYTPTDAGDTAVLAQTAAWSPVEDFTNRKFHIDVKPVDLDTCTASDGFRVRFIDSAAAWKEFYFGTDDLTAGAYTLLKVDPSLTADDSSGTLDITDIEQVRFEFNISSQASLSVFYLDNGYISSSKGKVLVSAAWEISPVMGIRDFLPQSGGEYLYAWDRRRIYLWDTVQERYEDTWEVDVFTMGDSDFVQTYGHDDNLIMANGVDPLLYADGASLYEIHTDWTNFDPASHAPGDPEDGLASTTPGDWNTAASGSYSRKIDTARFAFKYYDRIVLLYTTESGTVYKKRARWSGNAANLDRGDAWDINDWADAPTDEGLINAKIIGGDLIVSFERSFWRLEFQDDFRAPFRWVKIASKEGSKSRMAAVAMPRDMVVTGSSRMMRVDNQRPATFDDAIPGYLLEQAFNVPEYQVGQIVEAERLVLWTISGAGESYPDKALAWNFDELSFSEFDGWGFSSFGTFEALGDKTWDQMDPDGARTWDEITEAPDDKALRAGFPVVLAGDRASQIFTLFATGGDEGSDIAVTYETGRINPWMAPGPENSSAQNARLSHVDILADALADITLTVKIYRDFENTPYLTKTVTLESAGTNERAYKRVDAGGVTGRFHRVEITETGAIQWNLDAVALWMQPDGDALAMNP